MATDRNFKTGGERDLTSNRGERSSSIPNDLPDSKKDQEQLQPEETFIDLPDVKDIPGQEFVHVAPMGELADTTISSDDEEGASIIGLNDDDGEEENDTPGSDGNVSREERAALEDDTYMPTRDENNLREARMDNADFEGEPLNEKGFGEEQTGSDLDIPGSTDETNTEALGQGDEENKSYSVDDTDATEPSENRTGV
jgi:hypothetical protein